MNGLIVATIAIGLFVDRHGGAHGQLAVNVLAWAVFARLWFVSAPAQRSALLACLVYATAGEVFLSLVWGLYHYRLGNIPLFVPPGHVLLFFLGTQLAARLADGGEWWIAALALPIVAAFAWTGRDTLGPILFGLFLACMILSRSRKLYATMLVLSLAMELWGTWLGNWAWRREVPWLALVTDNPPLAAGAFYAALDLLVVSTVGARRLQPPASPRLTPSTVSHQAATCSARSSSR
ncbi:MAG TPA: hypothetical protein VFV55_03225 [Usitatibacteraceae bacterium]|nr:hypothetical protein [Usitatibacteraceae bacterium]